MAYYRYTIWAVHWSFADRILYAAIGHQDEVRARFKDIIGNWNDIPPHQMMFFKNINFTENDRQTHVKVYDRTETQAEAEALLVNLRYQNRGMIVENLIKRKKKCHS